MYSIIKEYVRTDCYAHSLGFLQKLRRIVQKDFPEIPPKDITVQQYGGRSKSGEFTL